MYIYTRCKTYKLKDYRNVKCGDLPSVPTMKQRVCVCVCAVQHSAPVFSCCCCCCSEKWLSFEEVGVTRDRLLPHSSSARCCKKERKANYSHSTGHTWRQGVYPLLHSVMSHFLSLHLSKLLYQVTNTSIPQPLHCTHTHTLSLR